MPVCNHSIVSVVNRAEAETLYTFLSKINPDVTPVLLISKASAFFGIFKCIFEVKQIQNYQKHVLKIPLSSFRQFGVSYLCK